ncbi:hypothetical protein F5B22DRAFT_340344 [Xylaria bambusicola]|uniref:uncharacterized protein n=1 Tax=Xylaria bambusicola TaxID=326684 RepID=UPI0020088F29|nr:uncharacterized protein F5B22DRAFT_340344 [Xylaria bambusicola]KAI0525424.1 hypothetical protein F5B22DRAFT_340344 [Xylaria bambusicola]
MSYHAQPLEQHDDERVLQPSRYRSLRKQSVAAPSPPTSKRTPSGNREPTCTQQCENVVASSISRSMSRYRRRAASNAGAMDNAAAQTINSAVTPPVPAIPSLLQTANPSGINGGQTEPALESSARRQLRHTVQQRTTGQTIDDHENHSNAIYDNNRDQITASSRGVCHKTPEQHDASWEVERNRLLEEQKLKDLKRLEEELERSQRVKIQSQKLKSPVVDKFMLLAKGSKNIKDETPPASPTVMSVIPSARRSGHEPVRSPPAHIEPGGKGIVPQKDAPTSAINAGDRMVAVRFRHHTFTLPVTPETTAFDIVSQISSRAGCDPEISLEKYLVTEHCGVLGLERRLRRYERIRDVVNSWDNDEQNRLAVTLSDQSSNHGDLDIRAVANCEENPSGFQLQMYHSNRPKKWNKKWITLLESGQIISAKKANAKLIDKDTANLCHLSDYDIYIPTESQLRRHIKPPKRFCFAIKSQHKTTIFLNTENYVQYFSTDDPHVAREFRECAHRWRSWYLVDRNPEVRKSHNKSAAKPEEKSPVHSPIAYPVTKKPVNATTLDGHHPRASMEESPRAVERYEPLVDMSRFDKGFVLPQLDTPQQNNEQTISRRLSKRNPNHQTPPSSKRESKDGFTGGLLGEEYETRKQALAGLEKKKFPQELAFTEGPSLLNSQQDLSPSAGHIDSPSWFPSAIEHTAKQRAVPQSSSARPTTSSNAQRRFSLTAATHRPSELVSSVARPSTQHRSQHTYAQQATTLPPSDRRIPPQPLVDLTPAIQVPPQWSKEKKGHGVKPPDDVEHLVDFISAGNGIDNYSQPPPRTVPRRPTTSGTQGRTRSMSSASPGRPLLDDAPPVPLVPSRHGVGSIGGSKRLANVSVARDGRIDRRESIRQKERDQEKAKLREQREREYREREAAYNAVPGRTGTLKVV